MESLHLSFQRVVDNGMFNGIKLSSSLSISHLFYADDAVFMRQWCDGNISTLIHVLECFYRASGLRINMSKSKILGVNVDSDKVKGDASKLGCLILKTPFTYLGSKVGGSMSRVHAWNEVIDRVKNRLSKWKMKTLSIGGITTPLKTKGINLLDCMHVKLGNGDKTVFWEDIWIDGKTLKNRFPRIYSLESCKLNHALVHDVSLIPMSDKWKWDLESSGDFYVASVRKIIDDKSLSDVDSKTRVETSRHLFFYCCMVRQIVRKITRWWDVPYVEVESYEDWYNWLVNLRISSMHKQMFEGIDVMRRLVEGGGRKGVELEVDSIIDKMRKGRLRWFGHLKRRPQTAPVRRVEALLVDGSRRMGRPKLRWEDRLKQDMKELRLSEDMTSGRSFRTLIRSCFIGCKSLVVALPCAF
ncbi:hypothetical protein Tco_0839967 [Tanacetum coccineum]|uniref:RNA-directed DNA polymerase, eukaryota, reverse transcriptase zinc-binding domain protein n=1 Tax=Tanacetum coccineum TaxID=301880 RepID=A0ABQ5AST5_9ASTR